MKQFRILAASLIAAFSLVGCVGGEGEQLPPIDRIQSISIDDVSVVAGTTGRAVAIATFEGGGTGDVSEQVEWSSTTPNVVAISNIAGSKGVLQGVREGSAEVIARAGSVEGRATVTVTEAEVSSIYARPNSVDFSVGDTRLVDAVAIFTNGRERVVSEEASYVSGDTSIATVSNASGSRGVVSGVGTGATNVTISYEGESVSVPVLVDAALEQIVVSGSVRLAKGRSGGYLAEGVYTGDSRRDITNEVTWSVDDGAVGSITEGGVLTGLAEGSVGVVATLDGVVGGLSVDIGPAVISAIAISSPNSTLPVGRESQFRAVATYSDGVTSDITGSATWSSSAAEVASVDAGGLVTAVSEGAAVISAEMVDDEGVKNGQGGLSVTAAVLDQVSVTPATFRLSEGFTQQLELRAAYSDGSVVVVTDEATWSSGNQAVAVVDNVSDKGMVSAAGEGSTTIRGEFDGMSATSAVEVTPAVLQSLTVTPASANLPAGFERQFTASGRFSDGSDRDVTTSVSWATDDGSVASISQGGLLEALAAGTTEVSASSNGEVATAAVTVTEAVAESLVIECAGGRVAKGASISCIAEATFSDNTKRDVTGSAAWESSDSSIASAGNGQDNGGQISGISPGTATITASISSGGSVLESQEVFIEVTGPVVTAVTVAPATVNLAVGSTVQLTATASFSDDTTQDVTEQAAWSADNTTALNVSNADGSRGEVTGLDSTGTPVVCVRATFQSTQSLCADVTVTDAVLTEIDVNPVAAAVALGRTIQFRASGRYSDDPVQERDATADVIWSSSDESIATVSNLDGSRGEVTTVAEGSVTITATDPNGNATSDSGSLIVDPPQVDAVAIDAGERETPAGRMVQLTATGTFSDGSTRSVTANERTVWTSSDESIATVSGGSVEGLAIGTVTITVSIDGAEASTQVEVTAAEVVALEINPKNKTVTLPVSPLDEKPQVQYQVIAEYSDGSFENVTLDVDAYASNNADVATINGNGTAQTQGPGEAQIFADFAGIIVSATLIVEEAVPGPF